MLFFPYALKYRIYSLKLYHLLNFTLHSKANACNIDTFIRFYIQMRVEKKAFAYRVPIIIYSVTGSTSLDLILQGLIDQ